VKEASYKWWVGTFLAVAALVLGLFQWLDPREPYEKPGTSPSPAPQTALRKTPMNGLSFWQGDRLAPMELGPESPAYVVHVHLKREPFEIRMPAPKGPAVQLHTWTTPAIFDVPQGAEVAGHYGFGLGHAMANGEYFDGNLFPEQEGNTYLAADRLTPIDGGQVQIYVSAFGDTRVQDQADRIYVDVFVDENRDGRFQNGEYEYVVLEFS